MALSPGDSVAIVAGAYAGRTGRVRCKTRKGKFLVNLRNFPGNPVGVALDRSELKRIKAREQPPNLDRS